MTLETPVLAHGGGLCAEEGETWVRQERTQPLADALRNAPAATARARESAYDPLPDLRRLRRGSGTPLMAQRDVPGHIGIMLRRDADFDRIVAAFRSALFVVILMHPRHQTRALQCLMVTGHPLSLAPGSAVKSGLEAHCEI